MGRTAQYASNAEKQRAYRKRRKVTQPPLRNIKIDHPPLRWLGGKWKLAPWIIEYFPPHVTYVEPFAGGAAVLLHKTPTEIEILNDLNGGIVNFFDVLRQRPDDLIRAIWLTPFSREIHQRAFQPCDDPLERALRFYIRCWQSFQPGNQSSRNSGWRAQKTNNRGKPIVSDWNSVEHLWDVASRLKMVLIENKDALKVINDYDSERTLFYVDPPYLMATRASSHMSLYDHEIDVDYHVLLAERLQRVKGMVIVSGYPHSLYDELYKGWRCLQKTSTTNAGGQSVECLWLNPACTAINALPLFDERISR
jgi:DNA adenine methylase